MKGKWNILNPRLRIVKTGSRGLQNTKLFAVLLFSVMIAAIFAISPTFSSFINSVVINSTGSISLSSITAKSGSAVDIQTAVNAVISAGGGTVYIPAGDWVVNQTSVVSSSGEVVGGGAIFIDLETLPAGEWLNIIGSYTNVTTTQQNGQTITCPATILRSYTVVNTNLTASISTFEIVGSVWHDNSNNNYVKSANRHIRISGITILGDVTNDGGTLVNTGIGVGEVDGFLIDHCFIDGNIGADIGVVMSKGVISNCNISQLYHITQGGPWGYGVQVSGNSNLGHNGFGTPTWITNLTQVIGKYDWQGINITYSNPQFGNYSVTGWTTNISFTAGPVYIENSYFYYCRHATASSQYGYYVIRYSVINMVPDNSYIDMHGTGYPSARAFEVYNNLLMPYGGAQGVSPRGGGGVIFNNTFNGVPTAINLELDAYNSSDPNNPQYINDMWIWGNTFINCGTPYLHVQYPSATVAGVNYYSDIPTPTSPAPPRPNYTPYTYPHPLTLGT